MWSADCCPSHRPSVGAHVVVRKSALDGLNTCLLVPETSDKRIMFANTWEEDSVIIGTTDHPAATTCAHPMASEGIIYSLLCILVAVPSQQAFAVSLFHFIDSGRQFT